ncbi:MAG: Nif3-like dinuclear metal center hexameric protein [Archaeoglobaceae archaeon]
MRLKELVSFLDDFLNVKAFRDKSLNGLQVEACEDVRSVAFAVDATLKAIESARGHDLLVVHHGILWGAERISGLVAKKVRTLMENRTSLYAAHLPLDAHEEIGNSVSLLKAMGCRIEGAFAEIDGVRIGFVGSYEDSKKLEEFEEILRSVVNPSSVIYAFGTSEVRRVAAVSGRGGFAIAEAFEIGADVFLTGEVELAAYNAAKDLGINIAFAGHYATERFGLLELMKVVAELGLEVEFVADETLQRLI